MPKEQFSMRSLAIGNLIEMKSFEMRKVRDLDANIRSVVRT